jgi:hypothetical protein
MSAPLNPLEWKRDHLIITSILIISSALIGAIIGHYWAWNIISREHLSPMDPYIPIIYRKFMAAWAVGLAAAITPVIYLYQVMRSR